MGDIAKNEKANPFSTSGSGTTFEQLVGAYYLVSLLAQEIPRGLDRGICTEVRFQQRFSGCLLDDIVVTAKDVSGERKLALQVKHNLVFSDSSTNEDFARVISDCWKTFCSTMGWKFNQETDRLAIGLGIHQTNVDRHFKSMLEWARASKDSVEFMYKVASTFFSSEEKRKYLQIIQNLLGKAKGAAISDDEIWRFLRCLVVINFDLENAGSSDATYCWNRLLSQLKDRDENKAKSLFNTLCCIVETYARSAGSIDVNTLRNQMPEDVFLMDAPNCALDLARLRKHSDMVLDSISDSIGLKVRLPRNEKIDELEADLRENDVVVISGEPMVGKSVLLKLLSNRLRSEGEVIVFAVERFQGSTLDGFLQSIHVHNELDRLLFSIGSAPIRCLLVDGLERSTDESKKRILNDLIISVRKFNDAVLLDGGSKQNCWRIIFTCRSPEAQNVLLHLETRKNLAEGTLKIMELGSLSNDEIAEVANQFPNLKNLASKDYLREILSRPFILDVLTLPNITVPPQFASVELSEVWLMDWYWREVVRLAEGMNRGVGYPEQREELLLHLAMQPFTGEVPELNINNIDNQTVVGLISDRLLVKEGDKLRFAHDVLEDWALTVLLNRHKCEISKFLLELGDSQRLIRPFRLFVSRLLELERAPDAWLNLLDTIDSESMISPRWHQIALTAPLFSPMLREILPLIQPCLLSNNGALLGDLLKAVRTICVQANPSMYTLFAGLSQEELDKYLAYYTIPVKKQWIPIIQFMLKHTQAIKAQVLDEFSFIAEKWVSTFINEEKSLRKEIALLSLDILNNGLLAEYKDEPKNRYILSTLYAADCLPETISNFVSSKAIRNRETDNYGFEDVILERGWIPLCKFLPETTLDLLGNILCEKMEASKFPNHLGFVDFMDLGIKHTHWIPPTYLEGPFLGFLRLHEEKGLQLIHRVVNHATSFWKKREQVEANRTPIPCLLKLECGNLEVWGDELVYQWYRYPSVAPSTITCALMALEYWMNDKLKNNMNPRKLFESVLKNTESVAVVGVCSSVALANFKSCQEAIMPILENPSFWLMDYHRVVQDSTAENTISAFSLYFSLNRTQDKAKYKILLELAKESHRKWTIDSFVLPILLRASPETQHRLKKAMQAFPDNPPVFFEEEKIDPALIQERKKDCELWSARAEIENYEKVEINGQIGIQFKLPAHLEKEQEERLRITEVKARLNAFWGWSMNLLDKDELSQMFTIESAFMYAQELACNDNSTYQPVSFLEDSEMRAQAIAAFAASILLRRYQWAKEKGYAQWLREQLLIAAKRPEPQSNQNDKVSRYPMGYRRSASRALCVLLRDTPKDKEVRKTALELSSHVNDEVKEFLFDGLKALWLTDPKIIWSCIQTCIKRSYIVKAKKPIGKCLPTEVDTESLKAVLYCIPTGSEISHIPDSKGIANFLEELLIFTINAYEHYQKNDHYNSWDHNNWNQILFRIITSVAMRLPVDIAESKFYNHILNGWERKPTVMQMFLRHMLLAGCQPELEDKLAEFWPKFGQKIILTIQQKEIGFYDKEMENIVGLLIFTDPARIVNWTVEEWKPLRKLIPFIKVWSETFGHQSVHFPTLVQFFASIGFSMFPEIGIPLLFDCLSKLDNRDKTVDKTSYALSELLCSQWSKNSKQIKQNAESMRQFVFMVDMLANQGQARALQLQSKLQDMHSDKLPTSL